MALCHSYVNYMLSTDMNIILWDVKRCGLIETYYMRSYPRRRLSSISELWFVSCDVIQHPFLTISISDRQSRQWWAEHQSFRDLFVPINSINWHRHRLWLPRQSRSPKLWFLAHQWHVCGSVSNLVKFLQRECFQSQSQFSTMHYLYLRLGISQSTNSSNWRNFLDAWTDSVCCVRYAVKWN
jgi:hypothetical protein